MKTRTLIKFLLIALCLVLYKEGISQWSEMASIPTPRAFATASTLNGKIYVIGGTPSREEIALQTVEVYDPYTNTWDTTATDYPIPVMNASSQVINDQLYVIGGKDQYDTNSSTFYNNVFAYDELTNSWTEKAPLPSIRAFHGSAVMNDYIYVIGGVGSIIALSTVFAYDPIENEWITLNQLPMPTALHAVQVYDDELYVLGGAYLGEAKDIVYKQNAVTHAWETVQNLPETIFNHKTAVLSDQILVFGGLTDFLGGYTSKTRMAEINDGTFSWVDLQEDMEEEVVGYALSLGTDTEGEEAAFLFSGATRAFYNGSSDTLVSENVMKFRNDPSSVFDFFTPDEEINLLKNYPNPANQKTNISFSLNEGKKIILEIINLEGKVISKVFQGHLHTGIHAIPCDVSQLTNGIYFYKISTDNGNAKGKMIVHNSI